MFGSMKELVEAAGSGSIAQAAKEEQASQNHSEIASQVERMRQALQVMRESSEDGLTPGRRSMSGLTGGGAIRLFAHAQNAASGPVMGRAIARALSVAECNACMGKIVAAPTAGACGILPAALLTMQETRGCTDDQLIRLLCSCRTPAFFLKDHCYLLFCIPPDIFLADSIFCHLLKLCGQCR